MSEGWRAAVLAANRELAAQLAAVTRVEVIDESGRAYGRWGVEVTPSLQDEGRTLKVFVCALGPATKTRIVRRG
jgi:hypothetical protein